MRPSKLKQMWKENKPVTLGWISMANSFSTEVMARQGFDALCIDLQHGATGMSDLLPMLQAVSQTDATPVVRVGWNDTATIMKALDLGAYAIIVPLVNTAEDAAKAVAACRYPPTGCALPARCARSNTAGPTTSRMPIPRSSSWR